MSSSKTYREAGFTFEEIQRIQSSIVQADTGVLIPESVVWDNISKHRKTHA